ncbi:MAG: Rab family GTPase, partial [Thermoplasmata archaeon]
MGIKKKVVLLGDSAVGKTSLIRRYVFDLFEDSYIATIGSKVTMKELKIPRPNKTVKLTMMIWDLLGREGYTAFHARTFAGVHGALLVADLTRKETLTSLERYWIPALFEVVENVPLVFVCNKSDLTGELEFEGEDIAEIASKYSDQFKDVLPKDLTSWYTTSAKTGSNVEKAFESLGHLMLSEKLQEDPVKELYQSLVATGIRRAADKTTLIGILDEIIVDFCEGFED